jgi:hypothetical protein
MKWYKVDSSALKQVSYDIRNRILFVEFRNGHVFLYSGVSNEVFQELLASSSKGAFFNKSIKPVYDLKEA